MGCDINSPDQIKHDFSCYLMRCMGVDRYTATARDRFLSLAAVIRQRLIDQWLSTQQTHNAKKVKRMYYMSLEFLMGRALECNILNLGIGDQIEKMLNDLHYTLDEISEQEVDAGLGNGGLGRLAACFLDSLASLDLPAVGYGLRYDYGIFRQTIENGRQKEHPDEWLRNGNPWEIQRPYNTVTVRFGGRVVVAKNDSNKYVEVWMPSEEILGIPYDTPIVGYGGHTVNTLRLWSAKATSEFSFDKFNDGGYAAAVEDKVKSENLTKVLYPNDKESNGKELRFRQQYFFVACTLSDIIRRFRRLLTQRYDDQNITTWDHFPDYVAIQLNDTHPTLAIPELMRILVDQEGLEWERAWDITVRTFGYTNHTLMPEALEKWSVELFERLLPRHLNIIYEINSRFLDDVRRHFHGDQQRISRMSLIEEGYPKYVRMAYLGIVGSHSINGVAALHSQLLCSRLVPDFAQMYPERFNNKTNGITHRRWLMKSNPILSDLITEAIGDDWKSDASKLSELRPYADDSSFRERFAAIKLENKKRFIEYCMKDTDCNNIGVHNIYPYMIFDTQVKRIHEYKRQLLNVLQIMIQFNRLRNGNYDMVPHCYFFAGKAAPGYEKAKLIIQLIVALQNYINASPIAKGKMQVYFLPNYRVSLAERIIPATEVSEQISTAGTEASGTGNMKFMMNGAITIGTYDGANIEIREACGDENFFLFGLREEEVFEKRRNYSAYTDYYIANDEIREAIDFLFGNNCLYVNADCFQPLRQELLEYGDRYMLLADVMDYVNTQDRLQNVYRDADKWNRMAIINVAASGVFSSDRTINEYAKDIWNLKPCDVERKPRNEIEEADRNNLCTQPKA